MQLYLQPKQYGGDHCLLRCAHLREMLHKHLVHQFELGTTTDRNRRGSKTRGLALHSQAFIGYSPIEEGGDNEINLHYTLSCDLSELLGATGAGGTGSSTKVGTLDRSGFSLSCFDDEEANEKRRGNTENNQPIRDRLNTAAQQYLRRQIH